MMKLELTKFQFPDEDGDVVRQDSLSEKDDGEYNEKENMLMLFKTFLYTVVFILFIFAASVIFMGIEGNHLKFKNLKNCRLRYDFGERLSEVSLLHEKIIYVVRACFVTRQRLNDQLTGSTNQISVNFITHWWQLKD